METQVLHLVNQHIQLAMSNALNSLGQILFNHSFASPTQPRRPSSSRQRERTFDVQYSFSLSQPLLMKINQQQCSLNSTRNFVDEFIRDSLQSALLQVSGLFPCEHRKTSFNPFDQEKGYGFDVVAIDHCQGIVLYVDRFVHSTVESVLGNITSLEIEFFSNQLADDIITDTLSTFVSNEIYAKSVFNGRTVERKSITFDNVEQQPYNSSSHLLRRASKRESIDSFVNTLAQQIYFISFDELRHLFTMNNSND